MSGEHGKPLEHEGKATGGADGGRRRLLIAGGAVLTLAAPSALAGVCRSPSGFTSGNLSQAGRGQTSCNGVSPGYWKNKPQAWPHPYDPNAKFYGSYFGGYQFLFGAGVRYPDAESITLMEVMNLQGNADPAKIGFHVIGALLNVAAGLIPPQILTQAQIFDMFNQFATNGVFFPLGNPTVQWGASDIVYYLQSNYISP